MATANQIAANQRNAQKSTGPKTDEGKSRSRANALKDGLTGNGVVLTPAQQCAVTERMEGWRPHFQPQGDVQEWVFRRMIVSTIQLDQIEAEQTQVHGAIIERATHTWDAERQLEAEQIGARLAANPAINRLKLGRSAQGCFWLVERWDALIAALQPAEDGQPGAWTEEQESAALDLLGVAPAVRTGGRKPWELTGDATALDLARGERDALAARHEALLELDAGDRARALAGYAPIDSPADRAIWRLRRLDQSCWRTFLWAHKQLAERPRSVPSAPQAPAPAPAPALPQPAPAPAPQEKRTHCDTGSRLPVAATKAPVGPRPLGPIDPMSINLTALITGNRGS